jgi:hypothetical protein
MMSDLKVVYTLAVFGRGRPSMRVVDAAVDHPARLCTTAPLPPSHCFCLRSLTHLGRSRHDEKREGVWSTPANVLPSPCRTYCARGGDLLRIIAPQKQLAQFGAPVRLRRSTDRWSMFRCTWPWRSRGRRLASRDSRSCVMTPSDQAVRASNEPAPAMPRGMRSPLIGPERYWELRFL